MVRLLALLCIVSIVGCAAPSNPRPVSYTLKPITNSDLNRTPAEHEAAMQKARALMRNSEPKTIDELLKEAHEENAKMVPEWRRTIRELQDIPQGQLTSRQRSDLYTASRRLNEHYDRERKMKIIERYKN